MQSAKPMSIATKLYRYTARGTNGIGDKGVRQIWNFLNIYYGVIIY